MLNMSFNSCIYKLKSTNPEVKEFYVGSTITELRKRINVHKNHYKKGMKSKVYNYIRDNGGWDSWEFEIIQEHITKDLTKLRDIENEYCLILKPTLNSQTPQLSAEQKENYHKDYNRKAREAGTLKAYIFIKCECGAEVQRRNIKEHRMKSRHINNLKKL